MCDCRHERIHTKKDDNMKSQSDEPDDMEDLATLEVLDEVRFLFLWHDHATNHTRPSEHTLNLTHVTSAI